MEDCMKRRPEHIKNVRREDLDCNWALLTKVLNDIIKRLNATTDKVQDQECRLQKIESDICIINGRLDDLELRGEGWDACCEEVANLTEGAGSIGHILDDINNFITWIKNHLPTMYEFIPNDWKFAMGLINLYGQGSGNTPNVAGNSIWTHATIDGDGNITVPTAVAGDTYVREFQNNLPTNATDLYAAGAKVALGTINVTSGGASGAAGIFTRPKDQNNDLDFQ